MRWAILLSMLLCPAVAFAEESVDFKIEQITFGPKHHLFGYIGQCKTIPWNADGQYVVALEVGFHDHMPKPDEAADIVLIDTREEHRIVRLDKTRAWNFQQGTMFYWHPLKAETQFFFNDRDPSNGHVFVVLYDVQKRQRVREYRYPERPIGNSGVAQAGHSFLGLNYGRLARLRPVTGYPEALDWSEKSNAPTDDGVFVVDVMTGEKRLLVSYRQLADRLRGEFPEIERTALFINHTLWNRRDDIVYFFVRGNWARSGDWAKRDGRVNTPCSIRSDGTGLTLHETHVGGHPEWAEDTLLVGRQGEHQVLYDVDKKRIVGQLGTPMIFPNPEGDISLSPAGDWLVNGYSERGMNYYVVYRRSDGLHGRTSGFGKGTYRRDLRIDPAPRWNRDGNALLVSGIAEDETRQLFVVHVRAAAEAP